MPAHFGQISKHYRSFHYRFGCSIERYSNPARLPHGLNIFKSWEEPSVRRQSESIYGDMQADQGRKVYFPASTLGDGAGMAGHVNPLRLLYPGNSDGSVLNGNSHDSGVAETCFAEANRHCILRREVSDLLLLAAFEILPSGLTLLSTGTYASLCRMGDRVNLAPIRPERLDV